MKETGTCIYGDRCCFSHSLTRSGPDLELSPSQPKLDQPGNTLQLKTNQSSNENPTSSKHQENNQAKVFIIVTYLRGGFQVKFWDLSLGFRSREKNPKRKISLIWGFRIPKNLE